MKPAESYMLQQEEPFRSLLLHLQMIIECSFPEAELVLKWKIPFYQVQKQPLCYLNYSKKYGYVDVGFWLSNHLEKYHQLLVSENRKVVKSLRYRSLDEVDAAILIEILGETIALKGVGFYKREN